MERVSAVPILWPYPGKEVYVTGEFNDFALQEMTGGAEKVAVLWLPAGTFLYRFLVDGSYMCDPRKMAVNLDGVWYHRLVVEDIPEPLKHLSSLSVEEMEKLDSDMFSAIQKSPDTSLILPMESDLPLLPRALKLLSISVLDLTPVYSERKAAVTILSFLLRRRVSVYSVPAPAARCNHDSEARETLAEREAVSAIQSSICHAQKSNYTQKVHRQRNSDGNNHADYECHCGVSRSVLRREPATSCRELTVSQSIVQLQASDNSVECFLLFRQRIASPLRGKVHAEKSDSSAEVGLKRRLAEMASRVSFAAVDQVHISDVDLEASEDNSAYSEVMKLVRYESPSFGSTSIPCAICGEGNTRKMAIGRGCHSFCETCVAEYAALKVKDGITQIACPSFGCQEFFLDLQLRRILSIDDYERLYRFRKRAEMEANPDFRWCPRPNCEGFAHGSTHQRKLVCNICNAQFCFLCGEYWHSSSRCKAKSELKFNHWMRSHDAKFCPKCRSRIEKNRGCSHMSCSKCHYEFCWLCGDGFSYAHARSCPVVSLNRRNPPWLHCVTLILTPLWLPFVFLVLTVVLIRTNAQSGNTGRVYTFLRKYWLSYPILLTLAAIMSPLAFAVCILSGFIILLIRLGHTLRYASSCQCLQQVARRRLYWNACSVFLGLVLSPLTALCIALFIACGPICGCVLLIWKGAIIPLVRCCRPEFMKPHGRVQGFPMG